MSEAMKSAPLPSAGVPANGVISDSKRTYMVAPSAIRREEGWNPRFDMGDIEELAGSILAQHAKDGVGVMVNLRAHRDPADPNKFILDDGDRRLTAVELLITRGTLFDKGIPVTMLDKKISIPERLIQMMTANTGKPFLPLEEAAAYKRMRDEGMTIEQIGQAVGRKYNHVAVTLGLLEADASVTDALKAGEIGTTLAKEITLRAKGDKATQAELVKEAKAAGKNKKALRAVKGKIREVQVARNAKKGKTLKIRALDDAQLGELGVKVAGYMAALLKDAGLKDGEQLLSLCASDDRLASAYTLGALHGLRVAAGEKINLKL